MDTNINTRIVKVAVTLDYINKGRRIEPFECPVALALTDTFGYPCSVIARDGFKFFRGDHYEEATIRFKLPAHVQRKIYQFDTMGTLEPFDFEVEVPVELEFDKFNCF